MAHVKTSMTDDETKDAKFVYFDVWNLFRPLIRSYDMSKYKIPMHVICFKISCPKTQRDKTSGSDPSYVVIWHSQGRRHCSDKMVIWKGMNTAVKEDINLNSLVKVQIIYMYLVGGSRGIGGGDGGGGHVLLQTLESFRKIKFLNSINEREVIHLWKWFPRR